MAIALANNNRQQAMYGRIYFHSKKNKKNKITPIKKKKKKYVSFRLSD